MAISEFTKASPASGKFLIVSIGENGAQRTVECWPTAAAARHRAADLQSTADEYLAQAGRLLRKKSRCPAEFDRCIVASLRDRAAAESGDDFMHLGVQYSICELLTIEISGRPSNAVSALLRGGKGVFWTSRALARARIRSVHLARADCRA